MRNDFATDHLETDEQRKIAETIIKTLPKGASGGGCQAFYTPQEWAERGEYGKNSVLILCHDGGALAPYCNFDYMRYECIDQMNNALKAIGYYCEQCTSWYSAVYPINPQGTR